LVTGWVRQLDYNLIVTDNNNDLTVITRVLVENDIKMRFQFRLEKVQV